MVTRPTYECPWQELNLEYGRYLKEVVQALESDQAFRKKLETAEVDDIKVSAKHNAAKNFMNITVIVNNNFKWKASYCSYTVLDLLSLLYSLCFRQSTNMCSLVQISLCMQETLFFVHFFQVLYFPSITISHS